MSHLVPSVVDPVAQDKPLAVPSRTDLVALARPRLMALGLITIAACYVIGAESASLWRAFALLVGAGLALVGASAMNQALEGETDALMRRTSSRPVPSGRVGPMVAAAFGLAVTAAGLGILLGFVNPLTAATTALGWLIYVAVYTPLKSRSSVATVVGAIPGAAPALIGWAAARGSFDIQGWALFAVMFLWQLPHFLAIAWMYRQDYRRAGLRMLPADDVDGSATARQILGYGLGLVPVSLLPTMVGLAGPVYFFGALLLGLGYLSVGLHMARDRTGGSARLLLKASVVYLPVLLALLAWDS